MQHVVEVAPRPFRAGSGRIEVHQIPAHEDNLVWLIRCVATGQTAVVDGPGAREVLDYCSENGITIHAILNTHTHPDHIGINKELLKTDAGKDLRVVGCKATASQIPGITEEVEDGDEVRLGELVGKVWLTEGHLNGHISYIFDDVLFCGDTLFSGGCGYLFDGPPETMHRSLSRLATLDPQTKVCCAHEYTQDNLRFAWMVEPDNQELARRISNVWQLRKAGHSTLPSTIGLELDTNPFLRAQSATLQKNAKQGGFEFSAEDAATVFKAVRAWKDRGDHRKLTDGDLPL